MGIGQTEQTGILVLARPNRPKYGYWPDRTDRNMGIGQTEQTEIWVLARPNRPKYGYWPDRTDRNLGIGQTDQAEIWVLARPNRPKYGYWPDRTDQNMGIGQTEQTEIWVFARPNRPKLPLARRKAQPKFFPDHCGLTGSPVRDPSRSGQYLSWVADFILGTLMLLSKNKKNNVWQLQKNYFSKSNKEKLENILFLYYSNVHNKTELNKNCSKSCYYFY